MCRAAQPVLKAVAATSLLVLTVACVDQGGNGSNDDGAGTTTDARIESEAQGVSVSRSTLAPTPPAIGGDWPDPEVVWDPASGRFYSYATNAVIWGAMVNVPGRSSPDLQAWSPFHFDALPTLPTWAIPNWIWAPAVARIGDQWVLYFTAADRQTGLMCTGAATSAVPRGPFQPVGVRPILCQADLGGSIDAAPFQDPRTGQWWLLWKSEENAFGTPGAITRLWSQPLDATGTSLTGAPAVTLARDHLAEGPLIESPDMAYVNGVYWLFYSANRFQSLDYFVHLAACTSPAGPCVKMGSPAVPWFGSASGYQGPGGQSLFQNPDGSWTMAFHAWPEVVGYAGGGWRATYLMAVAFDGALGGPRPRPDLPVLNHAPSADSPAGGPALAASVSSETVYYRGLDGALWSRTGPPGGPLAAPVSMGGLLTGDPDVTASWGSSTVTVRGVDGALWFRQRPDDAAWGPWRSLGGQIRYSPTIASWGPGRLDVAAVGTDGQMWHRASADNGAVWTAWSPLGGSLTASPDLTSWGPGRLDLFARGTDRALWHLFWAGSWYPWASLGGILDSAPAAVASPPGLLDVLARGADGRSYQIRWDGSRWSGWYASGGLFSDSPDAAAPAGHPLFGIRGIDGNLWLGAGFSWTRQ